MLTVSAHPWENPHRCACGQSNDKRCTATLKVTPRCSHCEARINAAQGNGVVPEFVVIRDTSKRMPALVLGV